MDDRDFDEACLGTTCAGSAQAGLLSAGRTLVRCEEAENYAVG